MQQIDRLLSRAAELAAANGVPTDEFMRAAYDAFLDARPGLREELATKQLRQELKKLRKRGLVGSA
jgi:hypothetical protein